MFKPGPYLISLALALALASTLPPARGDAPRPGAQEPIRVGVFSDFSGQTSSFGASMRDGIELAAERVNAAGGVGGRPLVLVVRDNEGRPSRAQDAVDRLIHELKAHAVIGDVASTNSLAAAAVAQEAGVPMITPASTNPSVTRVGDYIFRACFTDPFQGGLLAKFAARSLKARRAAVLADANSDYSRGLTEVFTRSFTALGGRVVLKQVYTQTDTDFAAQLVAIRRARPDVIFVPGYYDQAGAIAKQARRLGLRQPLLGGDGWDAPLLWKSGGAALNGSYMSNHYSADDPSPANRAFVAGYRRRHGREPDAIAALGYDALGLLADALARAGTTEGGRLRDAIARTANYEGVTGAIRIDEERNAVKPGVISKLHDGKFIYHETVAPD